MPKKIQHFFFWVRVILNERDDDVSKKEKEKEHSFLAFC